MLNPLDAVMGMITMLGGRQTVTAQQGAVADPDDAVAVYLGEPVGDPLLGAGADSQYEYIFPYSLFQGGTDPAITMIRQQLDLRYGTTEPGEESDSESQPEAPR
jgi:hypothetical protein